MTISADHAEIPLPKAWTKHVQVALLHVIALAHLALTHARAQAWQSKNAAVVDGAEREVMRTEIELLILELRVKAERMARVDPRRRPHYGPHQRLDILTMKAARGWTTDETAERFQVDPKTIAS